METKIICLVIFISFPIIAFHISNAPLHNHPKYDNGQRSIEYHFSNMLGRRYRSHPSRREKSRLKEISTTSYLYFSDMQKERYPGNPQDIDFDTSLFYFWHLKDTSKHLPITWKIPNTWEKLNQENTPIAFLIKPSQKFTGATKVPIAIIKKRFLSNNQVIWVTYEDGHVDSVSEEEAIKLWKKAGVW
jgi:hypothetical protein